MISTTSIFASFCGALVVLIVAFNDGSFLLQGCVFFPLAAFMLFSYTSEMITDALERGQVLIYLHAHAAYNLGVVMMLLSIALILFAKGYSLLAPLPVLGVWMPWLRDLIWLVRRPKAEWDDYLRELQAEERSA
jgi:hypothetical protein